MTTLTEIKKFVEMYGSYTMILPSQDSGEFQVTFLPYTTSDEGLIGLVTEEESMLQGPMLETFQKAKSQQKSVFITLFADGTVKRFIDSQSKYIKRK